MVKALVALASKPDCLLIDGNQAIPRPLFRTGKFAGAKSLFQKTIIKGDQLCISIAAALILAKVARDAMMVELDKQYPEYGFASHKGYSCAAHFEALSAMAHRRFTARAFGRCVKPWGSWRRTSVRYSSHERQRQTGPR